MVNRRCRRSGVIIIVETGAASIGFTFTTAVVVVVQSGASCFFGYPAGLREHLLADESLLTLSG